jgi:hypothetical protein
MVSCKNIYDIQVVPQSLDVFGRANVGLDVDFGGANALKVFGGKEQVVRGDLTGYRQTLKTSILEKACKLSTPNKPFLWLI